LAKYGSGSGPIGIQIQGFNDQKFKIDEKKIKFFFIKNYNLPIPRPPKRTSKLQKKPSALKRGHPTFKNMNFYNWVIFALLDPESDSESRSGSTDPIESGSNPDPLSRLNPDPQP
jgi:hypothetical protein